jgi:phosphatidylglycerophosphate synthase
VQSDSGGAFAFKAREIEELADVYFFRPLGFGGALAARRIGLSPIQVTLIAAAVGIAGGAALYDPRYGLAGFFLLIVHGILDSSDGQLARLTGKTSDLGRVLDGAAGYVTHIAIYVALMLQGAAAGDRSIVALGFSAALCNMVQAQLYDYHRSSYIAVVVQGGVGGRIRAVRSDDAARTVLAIYEGLAAMLAGRHGEVERVIAQRARAGEVRPDDRALYRACFYWPVRGWNLFGDNTRFYAIGLLAAIGQLPSFFTFVLVPMNAALVAVWLWQLAADRRFLARV